MNQEIIQTLYDHIEFGLNKIQVNGNKLSSKNGSCYTFSKLAVKILRKCGYNCFLKRVYVIVGNKKGRRIFNQQKKLKKFDKKEIIKKGGWVIGLGFPIEEKINTYFEPFHYVIWFPQSEEIMDLTFNQVARQQYNIKAEPYCKNINNLPNEIIEMNFIQDKELKSKNPLFYKSQLKHYFNKLIREGVKKIKNY